MLEQPFTPHTFAVYPCWNLASLFFHEFLKTICVKKFGLVGLLHRTRYSASLSLALSLPLYLSLSRTHTHLSIAFHFKIMQHPWTLCKTQLNKQKIEKINRREKDRDPHSGRLWQDRCWTGLNFSCMCYVTISKLEPSHIFFACPPLSCFFLFRVPSDKMVPS